MKNFDEFVAIDWSGAEKPVDTRSIAVAIAFPGSEAPHISRRLWSRKAVFDWLISLVERKSKRILVGIDCNFGYSEEVGEKQFGLSYHAFDLWDAVDQENRNVPNFFAGGFWENAPYSSAFWTKGKRPESFLMPKRFTEQHCGEKGYGWPESPFKLIGPKQVGKGGLAGMRMVLALKKRLQSRVAIFPFEEDTDKANMVITEIYPRLFLRKAGHGNAKIRTNADLKKVLGALGSKGMDEALSFSDHEADAIISAAGLRQVCGKGKTVPENVSHPPATRKVLEREGWIFGVEA